MIQYIKADARSLWCTLLGELVLQKGLKITWENENKQTPFLWGYADFIIIEKKLKDTVLPINVILAMCKYVCKQ